MQLPVDHLYFFSSQLQFAHSPSKSLSLRWAVCWKVQVSHLGEAAWRLLSRSCLFEGVVAPGDKKLTPTYFDLSHYWKCGEWGSTAQRMIVSSLRRHNKLSHRIILSYLVTNLSLVLRPRANFLLQDWLPRALCCGCAV